MHTLIVGSELVVLEKVGHLSPLEAPETVSRHLQRWRMVQLTSAAPSASAASLA